MQGFVDAISGLQLALSAFGALLVLVAAGYGVVRFRSWGLAVLAAHVLLRVLLQAVTLTPAFRNLPPDQNRMFYVVSGGFTFVMLLVAVGLLLWDFQRLKGSSAPTRVE